MGGYGRNNRVVGRFFLGLTRRCRTIFCSPDHDGPVRTDWRWRQAVDEILVLLLFYFGSAIALTAIAQIFDPEIKFVDFPPFWAGSFAIALIIGSYATETFRGAFLGVDPGQVEAARALGLSNLQTFIYVRIPAMWRLALPPFGNHMLSLIKDTALVAIIGLEETLFVAEQAIGYTARPFIMYILVGAIYLGFSTIITLSVMVLEKYANRHLEVA